jgi:carbonic anhydrase
MDRHARQEPVVLDRSRRKLLKLAALGGGVSLLAVLPEARSAGATDVLLLSCMDFRLMDDIERYMAGRGLRDKYDHVILAGASLGAVTDKFPAWNRTFWEHLDIAITLHSIHTVMIMDHRDCGAYKLVLGEAHMKDPKTERDTHSTQLKTLKGMINRKYPRLQVETLLMELDGKVEAA